MQLSGESVPGRGNSERQGSEAGLCAPGLETLAPRGLCTNKTRTVLSS